MGRHFDGKGGTGGDAYVRFAARGFTALPFGTIAAVVYLTSINTADPPTLVAVGGDPGDFVELFLDGSTGNISMWNGSSSAAASLAATAGVWLCIGVTKATGTATPRMHLGNFATGVMTHTNAGGTLANASGTGATEHTVGGFAALPNDILGDAAAFACWASKPLSDGEMERLMRGRWDLTNPDLLAEFPSGRDNPAGICRDQSRNQQRQNASAGQSRAPRSDPPGFRFSGARRRR